MTKIAPRQLLFFLIAIAPLGKLIIMPTQLVFFAKNDLLLSTLLNVALQTAAVFFVVLLSKQNKSLYELTEARLGKIAAKIFVCVLSLFLLYAALVPVLEHKLMVQNVFYDTLPSNLTFMPFFLLSAYLCYRPLSSFGRVWDIVLPLVAFGFLGICVFATVETDFSALLPIGGTGATGIFSGMAYTMSWFFDSALLLSFVGKIEYKKGLAWKSSVCYAAGGVLLLLFLALFYGVYSDIAVLQVYPFSKISKYFSAISVLGRIDYLFIHLISIGMAFYCILPLQASCEFLKQSFGDKKPLSALYSVAVNTLMLILSIVLTYSLETVEHTVTEKLFWIFPAFCLAIPVLCLLLRRRHA